MVSTDNEVVQMNLLEALKSGKKIRRKEYEFWIQPPKEYGLEWLGKYWMHTEVLADDWEIEDEPLKITRKDFWNAYSKAMHDSLASSDIKFEYYCGEVIQKIYKHLGFE